MKEVSYRDYKSGVKITFKIHSRCNAIFVKNTTGRPESAKDNLVMTRRQAFSVLCEKCKFVYTAIWDAKYETRR